MPCLLWGGLDKSRHIVPTALLVRGRCFRNDMYKAVQGPSTRPIILSMITGSYFLSRRRLTLSATKRNSMRIWPSLVWSLDDHRRPGERFLRKHILETIFYQSWIKAHQSMTWRIVRMYFEACDIYNRVSIVFEVIWRFLEWNSKTQAQHLANRTNWDM